MFTVNDMNIEEHDHFEDDQSPTDSNPSDNSRMHMMLAKMMEDKHTFTYRKLVVPMSMRSIYWKYFGFPATEEDEILTKVKIVCTICKTQISYNRNTSNLRMHLQNKHPDELHALEASCPRQSPKIKTEMGERRVNPARPAKVKLGNNVSQALYSRSIGGSVSVEGDLQFITDASISLRNEFDDPGGDVRLVHYKAGGGGGGAGAAQGVRLLLEDDEGDGRQGGADMMLDKKSMNDAIAEYLIVDLGPASVVEGKGFQALIATLLSPCEIPGKDKLEDVLIPKIYATYKEATFNAVANIPGEFGLSVEEWTHSNGESYVTISIFYQMDLENSLESKVLTTIHCSPFIDWGLTFDQFLAEWDVKVERVTAVVVATAQFDLIKALQDRGLTTVPCLVHSLQVCTYIIFAQEDVARVLSRIRGIVGLISRNAAASTALRIQLQMIQPMQQEETFLKMDHPRVWTSTYNMLEAFSLIKSCVGSVLDNIDGLNRDAVGLTEDDWKIVDDLVTVLEPFKVTMMTLGEEKFPLISLLKPLLWQLNSLHLKVKGSDSDTAQAFKESLSENLTERYSDANVSMTLQTATALDPRFKKLPYTSEEDKELVSLHIREHLARLVEAADPPASSAAPNAAGGGASPAKKGRLSGLEFILGDLCTTKEGLAPSERGSLELAQYQSESVAALDDCPLQWWSKASSRCPNLSKLAQKYNCVPASAIPVARIPVDAQVQFDLKRSTLVPDLVDKLLFLNGNHNLV